MFFQTEKKKKSPSLGKKMEHRFSFFLARTHAQSSFLSAQEVDGWTRTQSIHSPIHPPRQDHVHTKKSLPVHKTKGDSGAKQFFLGIIWAGFCLSQMENYINGQGIQIQDDLFLHRLVFHVHHKLTYGKDLMGTAQGTVKATTIEKACFLNYSGISILFLAKMQR